MKLFFFSLYPIPCKNRLGMKFYRCVQQDEQVQRVLSNPIVFAISLKIKEHILINLCGFKDYILIPYIENMDVLFGCDGVHTLTFCEGCIDHLVEFIDLRFRWIVLPFEEEIVVAKRHRRSTDQLHFFATR